MRTTATELWLDEAERLAKQSTCLRRLYGAVVVDAENTIVSTGYAGAPRGKKDCLQRGTCWRRDHDIPSGSRYEACRSVHAEMNALFQAGKHARGSTLYLAGLDAVTGDRINAVPCALCARGLVNAQIATVVMRWRNGRSMHGAPSVLSDLWDDALFNGRDVDWDHLRLK